MNIIVNGENKYVSNDNMKEAMNELGFKELKCATALNGNFISVDDREFTTLKEGDKIEVLSPQQGG